MSDKAPTKLSPAQIDSTGDRLARTAENGSLDAFNKELAQIRSTAGKGDYQAVVEAVKRNNTGHVLEDQRQVKDHNDRKWFFQASAENHVPTLIIEDRSKDKSHPDYKAVGYVVADTAKPGQAAAGNAASAGAESGRAGAKAAAGKGLDSDSIPFFAAYNEAVALREADKVMGWDRSASAPANSPAK